MDLDQQQASETRSPDRGPDRGQRYRLTASNLARYFKHGCDRLFRWESVGSRERQRPGIGEDVPVAERLDARPGIRLLMAQGDRFEMERVRELQDEHGEEHVYLAGTRIKRNGSEAPAPVTLDTFGELLRRDEPPQFVAQPEIDLERDAPAAARRFLDYFGLDPERVELRPSFLDLIEVRVRDDGGDLDAAALGTDTTYEDGRLRLRIWDFKASPAGRHEHFAQVAYYSFLLEAAVEHLGLGDRYAVDDAWGVIRSKQDEPEVFELGPYRRAVRGFLRRGVPELFDVPAAEAHYHVCASCLVCEYVETCEREAHATDDLSRIPYISSASKRRLNEAGITTCAELARLDPDGEEAEVLREQGHDLSVHLTRYVASARALGDGAPRELDATTLAVPAYEDVRVVVSAERDGVTGTVFALGLKTFEGWESGRVQGTEEVFVADEEGEDAEARILAAFLAELNGLFERVHAHNHAIEEAPSAVEVEYQEAQDAYQAALADEREYKRQKPARLSSKNPEHAPFYAWRDRVKREKKEARDKRDELKDAAGEAWWERRKQMKTLHVYAYDGLDLAALKSALERHLGDRPGEHDGETGTESHAALRREIVKLVRLFPPESVLPDADTFRSVPGTVVVEALRRLVALPAPFLYDLKTVSALYRPTNAAGETSGSRYLPRYGFGWAHSNQVAFERIHDVWKDRSFAHDLRDPDGSTVERTYSPAEVLDQIEVTVRGKLRATDSVVRRLKEDHQAERDREAASLEAQGLPADEARRAARGTLLLRKEPFRLYTDFDPTDFSDAEALQTFALLESALAELQARHLHTLGPEERAAKFESICGLRYLPGQDEDDGSLLWFTFDPASRDTKRSEGEGYLVVTPEDEPDALLKTVDGPLFAEFAGWRGSHYRVTIETLDPKADPPRIRLRPDNPEKFREVLGLDAPSGDRPSEDRPSEDRPSEDRPSEDRPSGGGGDRTYALDKPHSDPLTERLLGTLDWLRVGAQEGAPQALRVAELLATGDVAGWSPFLRDVHRAQHALRRRMREAGQEHVLNAEQQGAIRGVTQHALSMIWGPPGTGKTHVVGHLLALYALAAKEDHTRDGRPLRVYVTASTHHATVNVLRKTVELAAAYGIGTDTLGVVKLGRVNDADAEIPDVSHVDYRDLRDVVGQAEPACLVVGGTVWELYKALRREDKTFEGRPLFDVVLVDEASQMTLPQALIAFAAAKPDANLVLAGDDKQLPPIVHGTYPEEHDHLLSSVFAFARQRAAERGATDRVLFQLTRNFRMNEPLTAYPREAIYKTYESHFPAIRITLASNRGSDAESNVDAGVDVEADGPVEHALHPERPAVLVRYQPPVSFTARNPLEAALAARLVARLAGRLIDPETEEPYTPEAFAAAGVAVLAPHRAQNAAIRAALAELGFDDERRPAPLVDTVEKLQGKERQAIVVSYGVADAEYADAEADFLLSQSRFNVAATRAQRKLVVLCSDPVLNAVPSERQALLEATMLKEFRDYCTDGVVVRPWEYVGSRGNTVNVDLHLHWKAFGP